MNNNNFNTNYIHNPKNNNDKIKEIVEEIMGEEVNPQTLDYLFRYSSRLYPEITHVELELPGKFEAVKDTAAFVIDGTAKQMDYLEAVSEGGIIKRKALVNVEQQAGKLSDSKAKDIFEYSVSITIQEKRICYPVVATDYDYGSPFADYEIEGQSFRIYFRIFNREKIYEMLNILKEKDYNKYGFSATDYIRLVYCIIFAKKEFAKDVIAEVTSLFVGIEIIDGDLQINVALALKMMIKFRFGDDLKRKRELLIMIVESIHEDGREKIIRPEVSIEYTERLKFEKAVAEAERDKMAKEWAEDKKVIAEKNKQLAEMAKERAEDKKVIAELKKLIKNAK